MPIGVVKRNKDDTVLELVDGSVPPHVMAIFEAAMNLDLDGEWHDGPDGGQIKITEKNADGLSFVFRRPDGTEVEGSMGPMRMN